MKQQNLIIHIILLLFVLFSFSTYAVNDEKINIDLFVMSMCPYGIQSQNIIIPIVKQLDEKFKVNIYFVASESSVSANTEGKDNSAEGNKPISYGNDGTCINNAQQSNGRFSSLHGEKEVIEDIRQLLIIKYFEKQYYDYLMLRNKDVEKSDPVEIMKSLGIDAELIENLVKSEEGENLLSENIKEAQKRAVNASPTVFINGQLIEDSVTANRIYRNLCKNVNLANCSEIPQCGIDNDCSKRENFAVACINPEMKDAQCVYGENIPVKIAIILDQNIQALNPEQLIQNIKANFPAAILTNYDYKSEEASKLIKQYSLEYLPAIIFEEKVDSSIRFSKIAPVLKKIDDVYIIKSEYLANRFYINRPYKKKALELFVNSMSENSARLQNLLLTENRYSFSVNYNAEVTMRKKDNQLLLKKAEDGTYNLSKTDYVYDIRSSLGKEDLMEDIRQLCLNKYNPELMTSYLRCFTNELINHGSPGNCLVFFVKDSKKIDDCIAKSDGIEMLAKNAAYSKNIEIGSDTAVMIHNQILLQEFDYNIIYEILEKSDL